MSGTSTDGIDGVLVDIDTVGDSQPRIAMQAAAQLAFPPDLRTQINAVIADPNIHLDALGELNCRIGGLYAQLAAQLIVDTKPKNLVVIGCHGQTVRHCPPDANQKTPPKFPPKLSFSIQLGNGAIVAQRCKIATVADYRSADIAAGGQGAPLACGFHRAAFASGNEHRAVLNLGGIANLTHLPAGCGENDVIGFDTGPANTLLDLWCAQHFDAPFDNNGEIAASGAVCETCLNQLLSDRYFSRPPPKSSGREYFNREWLAKHFHGNFHGNGACAKLSPADALATLTALTAETAARQLNALTPPPTKIFVCGGGAKNKTIMNMLGTMLGRMLGERCDADIDTTDALGIAPQWVEACAFAWMAWRTLNRLPSTLPTVTGAAHATIAGAIYFPPS